jgi:hypothetical protein
MIWPGLSRQRVLNRWLEERVGTERRGAEPLEGPLSLNQIIHEIGMVLLIHPKARMGPGGARRPLSALPHEPQHIPGARTSAVEPNFLVGRGSL